MEPAGLAHYKGLTGDMPARKRPRKGAKKAAPKKRAKVPPKTKPKTKAKTRPAKRVSAARKKPIDRLKKIAASVPRKSKRRPSRPKPSPKRRKKLVRRKPAPVRARKKPSVKRPVKRAVKRARKPTKKIGRPRKAIRKAKLMRKVTEAGAQFEGTRLTLALYQYRDYRIKGDPTRAKIEPIYERELAENSESVVQSTLKMKLREDDSIIHRSLRFRSVDMNDIDDFIDEMNAFAEQYEADIVTVFLTFTHPRV